MRGVRSQHLTCHELRPDPIDMTQMQKHYPTRHKSRLADALGSAAKPIRKNLEMNIDSKIDAFVREVNSSTRELLPPEEVPEFLRIGSPDRYGQFSWSISKSKCEWIQG